MGNHDGHTLNLVAGGADDTPTVKNIDLQYSFAPVIQPGDLKPHWEKQVSVVSTLGGTIRSALAGKVFQQRHARHYRASSKRLMLTLGLCWLQD